MKAPQLEGYVGKVLEVDIGRGSFKDLELDSRWIELYVGGGGYATRLLYDLVSRDTDPLSPGNPLIAMTGPLTGLAAISPKTLFVARSPLTGFLGKAAASGSFGAVLKRAGYDGFIVKGKARSPILLSIVDGVPRIDDASSIWGKGVFETCKKVRDSLRNQKARIAAIGPAGERLVKVASVITDERRAFGRTGFGALMGSKLLKAIAVSGKSKVNVADEKKLVELNKEYLALAPTTSRGGGLKAYGTGGGVIGGLQSGNLPIKNWMLGSWPGAEKITSQTFMEKYKLEAGMKPCGESVLCSIQCERRIKMNDPKYGESVGKGPEYETLAALGSMTLTDSIEAIIKANDLCDDLGVDTISVGSTIAWAMEAYERGILGDADIGFPLKWGDGDAIIKLIRMIAFKEGIGALLSEGVKEASSQIGRGSEKFAVHTKGLEVAMHNPRLYHTMGVLFSVSNIGGSHLQGMGLLVERGLLLPEYGINSVPTDVQSKIRTAVIHQSLCAFIDSTGQCKFGVFGVIDFDRIAKIFNTITGRSEDKDSILKIGDRIWYLERLLNIKLGLTPRDDRLPERFVREPVQEGPIKGAICPIDELLPEFYRARALDPVTGMPSMEKLKELELDV
ncbi:MAG: aldehyde ferredoxin oxidoreductase family protein [Nitrososphaeria archaeon]